MLSPTWGVGDDVYFCFPLRALVTICLWGISVGLRLGLCLVCWAYRSGNREVWKRSLRLADESDSSLLICGPGASSSFPGRSPEGAKIPSPGGSIVVYFCQIIKYESSLRSCPSWTVGREVRHSPSSSLTPREQLLHTQPSKAAPTVLPDRRKAGM